MEYSSWKLKYWLQKVRLLRGNEKDIGDLLTSLRKDIYIPEAVTADFRHYIDRATRVYSDVYAPVLFSEMSRAVTLEASGFEILNKPFLKQAGLSAKVFDVDGFVTTLFDKRLPSGMTLSDRIWDLGNYSKDIEAIVKNGLVNKLSPESISKQLDGFILPNHHTTTLTPYGRALNFDSMRLARTEVLESFRRADVESARQAPWVTGLQWQLGSGHKDLCECDELDGQVFKPEDAPMAPHPQCACALVPEVMTGDQWDNAFREYTETGIDDYGIGAWLAA